MDERAKGRTNRGDSLVRKMKGDLDGGTRKLTRNEG